VAFRCFFRGKMENEKCLALIHLYKSKAVLCNSKSANYHNKGIRGDVWKGIGDEMKMPVQDLKNDIRVKFLTVSSTNSNAMSRISLFPYCTR
jgi:hypothetical protein